MSKTILIVDDEERLVSLLKAYLGQEGFRVVSANNGREALFQARYEKPDLIILDIMMPEMDGYEFMRQHAKESETRVILLTAKIDESDKVLGLELGADDVGFGVVAPELIAARTVEREKAPGARSDEDTTLRDRGGDEDSAFGFARPADVRSRCCDRQCQGDRENRRGCAASSGQHCQLRVPLVSRAKELCESAANEDAVVCCQTVVNRIAVATGRGCSCGGRGCTNGSRSRTR